MTTRSIRRAQERKARKEMDRKARKELDPQGRNEIERTTEPAASKPEELLSPAVGPEPDSHGLEFLHPGHPALLTLARLKANLANAQLSTGSKTSEGKAKASLNAVKTALTGRTVLLPADDAAAYECHIQSFADDYSPVGLREANLVQSIADTWWRLKRIPSLESALFALGYVEFAGCFDEHDASLRPSLIEAQTFLKYEKQLRNLQLQEARLFRRYEKDRAELRQLQQERRQKEVEALERVSSLYMAAKQAGQPFDLAEHGFEFSSAQIEQHLERVQAQQVARSTARSADSPAGSRSKTHAKAA
jgi:hypothetical protein